MRSRRSSVTGALQSFWFCSIRGQLLLGHLCFLMSDMEISKGQVASGQVARWQEAGPGHSGWVPVVFLATGHLGT